MRLASRFMFVHSDARDGTVFTAEDVGTGYRVSWLDDGHSDFKSTHYLTEDVRQFIVNGEWIIREVLIKEEQGMEEATKAKVLKLNCYGTDFELFAEDGEWRLYAGATPFYLYTQEQVDQYLAEGSWKRQEEPEQTSLEPVDDIVAASWPFPSAGTNAVEPETEFLPPDDIDGIIAAADELAEEETSLGKLRQWAKELGAVIEVDEDFYTVRKDGVAFAGKSASDLVSIVVAIRTLDKYADKG